MLSDANETITIQGIIVPVAWSSSGQVVCIAVATFDEKEYRIAGLDTLDQWRDYLNMAVSIQGRPFKHENAQWITVANYRVIKSVPQAGLNKK